MLLLAALFCLTACNKDGDETIALEFGDGSSDKDVDTRLDNVVPSDIQDYIDDYMPLYRGKNPPNIEGVYHFYPIVIVYCSDGEYNPGEIMGDNSVIKISNQNSKNNTLDYDSYDLELSQTSLVGKGAFVSGSGNDFTAYFVNEGTYDGIYAKMAMIFSGTKTSQGIKNLRSCSVMLAKNDPGHDLMDVGTYRISKDQDGLSENYTWNPRYSPTREIGNRKSWLLFHSGNHIEIENQEIEVK